MDKPPKNPFDSIEFWVRVLKISLIVLVPYWSFGFEGGVLVGIIIVCLFLSKISLTLLEIKESGEKSSRSIATRKVKPKESETKEGKIFV